ncbi:DUF429 domain-containing protein [Brumicola nitratireducens]|uniref:DUF429 domain-containing protein n=1 Tax=Glaciecola nitratireducens (strain JCM 12485 / KCTC 12276 / FR1064) TaxID=1085623 RepID=G4QKZ6_GLANF|nr:DUF429 domain-containing protein [Glaciecola nitratireducens]AEP29386.1 hypothetical protein GNIT_1262 [Glaciecola nitratireducens FR1064]
MKAYIGIDVSCAKKKRCPIAICIKENDRLVPLLLAQAKYQPPFGSGNAKTLFAENNTAYAAGIKSYIVDVCKQHNLTPARIAIDAPLLPKKNDQKRRIAERELDRQKISCYATPSQSEFERIIERGKTHLKEGGQVVHLPHSIQIFMLAGFAIYQALKNVAECIEVFPHATAKLLGTAGKHKTKDNQAHIQLHAMSKYAGWPRTEEEWGTVKDICSGDVHDKVDAYSAAWIASLDDEQHLVLGNPSSNDAIYLPRLETLNTFDIAPLNTGNTTPLEQQTGEPKSEPVNKSGMIAKKESVEHDKICPGCGQHNFKRWPWGWDAHAAFKCSGLKSENPELRKQEFKAKFL